MDAPADQSTSTSAPPVHSTLREAVRSPRRRRPTGAPPPLPYRLQTSGVGWLVAAVVLVGLELAVFGRGLRGAAVAVTVADDAVVRWLGGLHAPGLEALWQGLANVGSWWTLMVLWIGLVLALVVLRRWRHLIVWLVAWQLGGLVTDAVVGRTAQRARPFGVDLRTGWGGGAGRRGPGRVGHRRPQRRALGGGHRGHDPAAAVSPVHPQRGVPGHLPAGPQRPPGRGW